MERLTERLENGVIKVKYASQHETAIQRPAQKTKYLPIFLHHAVPVQFPPLGGIVIESVQCLQLRSFFLHFLLKLLKERCVQSARGAAELGNLHDEIRESFP